MKATLNDLLNAKGVSEPLREAVKVLTDRLRAVEKERDALRAELDALNVQKEQEQRAHEIWMKELDIEKAKAEK